MCLPSTFGSRISFYITSKWIQKAFSILLYLRFRGVSPYLQRYIYVDFTPFSVSDLFYFTLILVLSTILYILGGTEYVIHNLRLVVAQEHKRAAVKPVVSSIPTRGNEII